MIIQAPDVISVNLNIFKDAQTNKWMCSASCPCEDSDAKASWVDFMTPDQLLFFYDRDQEFQFGPLEGSDFTVKTYEECIQRADEN